VLLLGACAPFAADAPPVTAQRPLLSSDTATVPLGQAEAEVGVRYDHDDDVDVPSALKLGVGDCTELFFEWSPWVHLQQVPDGHSDLLLGGRHRLRESDDGSPALAVQVAGDAPVGDEVAGGDHADLFAAAIATQRWSCTALTAYYQIGALGIGEATAEFEHVLALAAAHSLDQHWGLFAELAGVVRPESDSEASVWTAGFTFATAPYCVFDVALANGSGDAAIDLQVTVGMTINLGSWR